MIRLPEGNQKFLLLDTYEVERNSQRGKTGSPVAVVVERIELDGETRYKRHVGYTVLTNSPVTLAYAQRGVVCPNHTPNRRTNERAAYTTWGEVVITTDPDEVAAMPEVKAEAAAATEKPAPAPTKTKTKNSNG